MELNLKNKVVLITGALGGIGSTLVRDFRSHGAIVYGTDISTSQEANYIQGDLTNDQFLSDLVNGILEKERRIDVLVNNAGIYLRTPAKDITRSEWERLMDINLTSVFLLTQLVIDKMISQKSGAIVSLASVAGKVGGLIAGAHYAASKAAVECLTKSLAKLGAINGVRVNAVAPGIIDTSMQDGVPAEQMEFLMKNIPMGRLGTATEVADAIIFLASDAASYITGQTISINGGTYM